MDRRKKLSNIDDKLLKVLYKSNMFSKKQLAKMFNVSEKTVYRHTSLFATMLESYNRTQRIQIKNQSK